MRRFRDGAGSRISCATLIWQGGSARPAECVSRWYLRWSPARRQSSCPTGQGIRCVRRRGEKLLSSAVLWIRSSEPHIPPRHGAACPRRTASRLTSVCSSGAEPWWGVKQILAAMTKAGACGRHCDGRLHRAWRPSSGCDQIPRIREHRARQRSNGSITGPAITVRPVFAAASSCGPADGPGSPVGARHQVLPAAIGSWATTWTNPASCGQIAAMAQTEVENPRRGIMSGRSSLYLSPASRARRSTASSASGETAPAVAPLWGALLPSIRRPCV